jgi:hypothetical protein
MTEVVLDARTLPEPLSRLIRTAKVKVRETHGEFLLTPIKERDIECPLLGMFTGGKISVDKFIAAKQAEKELEL